MSDSDNLRKLVDYIQRNLSKGYTEESLKWALIRQGYSRSIVEMAFKKVHQDLSQRAPMLQDSPKISHELIDDEGNSMVVEPKKPWWKRLFGLD